MLIEPYLDSKAVLRCRTGVLKYVMPRKLKCRKAESRNHLLVSACELIDSLSTPVHVRLHCIKNHKPSVAFGGLPTAATQWLWHSSVKYEVAG